MDYEYWVEKNNKPKRYAHFDNRISLKSSLKYITNPKNIEAHSFYPFIHYVRRYKKFDKESQKKRKLKERNIFYASHIDTRIYQYYSYKLNERYNLKIKNLAIQDCPTAYRTDLGKTNIDFAKEVFDFIKAYKNSWIYVGDFSDFFDNLNHHYLKCQLRTLFEKNAIPKDFYTVFKNITRFSYWELNDLLSINNLEKDRKGIRKLNNQEKVLSKDDFKKHKKQSILVNTANHQIPQGSPISAVLSNIYMMGFDSEVNKLVHLNYSGLYRRYSDDFIIVIPNVDKNVFDSFVNRLNGLVNSMQGLELNESKTAKYQFGSGAIINSKTQQKSVLNYLGFTFDGDKVKIVDRAITKYHYRMYKKIKGVKSNNGINRYGRKKGTRNLYLGYSVKGSRIRNRNGKRNGNFITYVSRAQRKFGPNEDISAATKNHLQKIRKRLKGPSNS